MAWAMGPASIADSRRQAYSAAFFFFVYLPATHLP
jgi:hypothetical protein